MRRARLLSCLVLAVLSACGSSTTSSGGSGGNGGATSASTTDASSIGSATSTSSTSTSASTSASSSGDTTSSTGGAGGATSSASAGGAGGTGGGAPLGGYGVLSGTCGEIDLDDIVSAAPSFIVNEIDFSTRPAFNVSYLSPGGKAMYAAGNLNQSSLYSEIFAYEVLYRCEDAVFLKGETEIVYDTNSKKTDLLVEIDGDKVGVSVVRAESYPKGSAYPVSQAYNVLQGKLSDILLSSASVSAGDRWKKQILSILAQDQLHADAISEAYTMIDPAVKADTIVVVTITDGDDDFIYYN